MYHLNWELEILKIQKLTMDKKKWSKILLVHFNVNYINEEQDKEIIKDLDVSEEGGWRCDSNGLGTRKRKFQKKETYEIEWQWHDENVLRLQIRHDLRLSCSFFCHDCVISRKSVMILSLWSPERGRYIIHHNRARSKTETLKFDSASSSKLKIYLDTFLKNDLVHNFFVQLVGPGLLELSS